MTRTLVAGVGDIFLGDDGFGCEVIRRLADRELPDGVTARDFGIGGIHLAYELLDAWDRLVLVDALPRGEPPGTLSVLRPDAIRASGALPDAHGMHPLAVFDYLATIGGQPVPTLIVGCEPATTRGGDGPLARGGGGRGSRRRARPRSPHRRPGITVQGPGARRATGKDRHRVIVRLLLLALLALIGAVAYLTGPDVARYLRMRQM